MAKVNTFPHAEIRVKDTTATTRTRSTEYPLHRPFVPIIAERGEPFVPQWCSGSADAINRFGEETFNKYGKFYGPEQLYLEKGILTNQGAFIVRLVSPDAAVATVVVECQVTPASITQYERDVHGGIVKDAEGVPVPLKDGGGNVIQESGYILKYTKRVLAADEKHGFLKPRTIKVNGNDVTIYPIASCKTRSPGAFGNKTGLSMYFDYSAQDADLINKIEALQFTFVPVEQTQGSNIATVVRDIWGSGSTELVMKANQVDTRTDRRISWDDLIKKNFTDTSDASPLLPYDVILYSESFETIGNLILAVETTDVNLTNPWMVDILSAKNLEGYPYAHAQVDTASAGAIMMNENYIIYLSGGSDGDTSWATHQLLLQQYLNLEHYPEIQDDMRYPLTHIYDVGYGLDTKYAILKFLAVRDNCKAVMATQDVTKDLNTMEEDQSAGSAIRGRALLQPESTFFGTGCCRAEIFQQAGYLNDTSYKGIVPTTLWSAMKRTKMQSSTQLAGMAKGYPEHIVDIYSSYNWAHYDPDRKQLSWDTGLNYFQHFDMDRVFYADVRTVYLYDTSVLSDSTFTDCMIYLKYIIREVWARYAGVTVPIKTLFGTLEEEIQKRAYKAFGGFFPVSVKAYQTIEEAREGDIVHIQAELTGYGAMRKMVTDIICKRDVVSSDTTTVIGA